MKHKPLSLSKEQPINNPTLRLLHRSYCHLCDDMLVALNALRGETGVINFGIDVIDIDADPALVAEYDELVPVLLDLEGQMLCHYFLDSAKVREYLNAFR
ncbi:MAG: glutaredoxin family protein [Rugosibacter sp.]|nr:glutaredoxin family protein [Rugosibacter sp.]